MPIKVNNLFYTYLPKSNQETNALKNVSFKIKEHSFVGILGATGSGKSTLIQTFNALLLPTSGSVDIDEFTVLPNKRKNKNIKKLRKHLSLVFQFPEYQLFEETVEKDVAFGLRNFGYKEAEAIEKAHEALKKVGLDETYYQRSPFDLSGGEKRRVAIAGIIAIDPEILILDEPTVGLDPVGCASIMHLIKEMHEQGKTIIVVTHDMEMVMEFCEKVFVLKQGELIFEGTPNDLFASKENADFAIEIPPLFMLVEKLIEKGMKLDIKSIRSSEDLVKQIKEKYHG